MNRCWALLAAALLVPAAYPQALPVPAAADSRQSYLDLIEQEREAGGITSPDLIEPLTALGTQYYEQQEYDLAIDAFAEARHVMRVNQGLDTVAEIPLLALLVRNEEARGNIAGAWELEQSLLALAEQHLGKLETLSIFRDVAEKRLELRRRYLAGERLPQIELGCYYGRGGHIAYMALTRAVLNSPADTARTCTAGERDSVNVALLVEARTYQMLALEALLQNDRYASAEMLELVTDILRTSDAMQRRLPLFNDPALAEMMIRLLIHEPEDSASEVRRAQFLLQLADMNVVRTRQADRYGGYEAVLEQYQQAYEALRNENVGQALLDETFAPAVPIVLPTFLRSPLPVVAEAEASGYIDVAFEITSRGKSREVRIVASENVERADSRELLRQIGLASFRPRVVEGQVVESAPVVVRYYLGESPN